MSQGQTSSLAVVVFQLGGPDSLAAVEPFLFNLFSDPDIVDFPFARLARPTLARLVSARRARHVQEHYASIGGRSPIRELTELQARALERELRATHSLDARVFVALRYWHPLTATAIEQVVRGDFRQLVLLPLYPQYSKTTTGSSLNEWQRQYARAGKNSLPPIVVRSFYDHPMYLDALVERINEGLARFRPSAGSAGAAASPPPRWGRPVGDEDIAATEDVHLVFSAHGVPVRVIEAGDPYQEQIEETVRLVMERGGWRNPHTLCYQSRVNPGKWLEPSLSETLRRLAASPPGAHLRVGTPSAAGLRRAPARARKRVLVIPISFVTDHVETLAEINIEARQLAQQLGLAQFELMPALNDSPTFIRALAELVLAAVAHQASGGHSKSAFTAQAQSAQR
jgi:ferrochelatase